MSSAHGGQGRALLLVALLVVPVVWVGLDLLGHRTVYADLAAATMVLVLVTWRRGGSPLRIGLGLAGLALLAASSPVDVAIRWTGCWNITLAPVEYGIACSGDPAACRGCTVGPNDPLYVLIVSL